MKYIKSIIPILFILLSAAPALAQPVEEEVSIDEVPELVLDAAREALPGVELVKAVIETTDEGIVYEIQGVCDGEKYEIEVSEAGEVLEVELKDVDDIDIEDDNDTDEG